MLSNTAEYALRAVIYLGERHGAGTIRVDQVAEALDVPRNYLSKILHTLVKRRVLRSVRGPHGGFELARPPADISLYEVVSPFDDIEARRVCLLGRRECSDENPCAIHGHWRGVAVRVAAFFRDTPGGQVVESAQELGGVLGRG